MKRSAVGALVIAWTAYGGQLPLAFEVASVKAAPPPTGPGISSRMSQDGGRITYSNVSLKAMISKAYSLVERQITGPDWLQTQRFDVAAKLPEGATKEQVPQMLQSLLAERFALQSHKESKVLPVYALVVGKSGSKMKAVEKETGMGTSSGPRGTRMNGKVTMESFANSFSGLLDRPVVDRTDLKGAFDVELIWSSEEAANLTAASGSEAKTIYDSADGASVFTAIQAKLGLKLEPRKAPVDFLVIDHAEKVPTEN